MFWPIATSTATTLCAFLPMLFWPGIPGQFMRHLPITLIFVLSASLLVALIFLPVVGASIHGSASGRRRISAGLAGSQVDNGIIGRSFRWVIRKTGVALRHSRGRRRAHRSNRLVLRAEQPRRRVLRDYGARARRRLCPGPRKPLVRRAQPPDPRSGGAHGWRARSPTPDWLGRFHGPQSEPPKRRHWCHQLRARGMGKPPAGRDDHQGDR